MFQVKMFSQLIKKGLVNLICSIFYIYVVTISSYNQYEYLNISEAIPFLSLCDQDGQYCKNLYVQYFFKCIISSMNWLKYWYSCHLLYSLGRIIKMTLLQRSKYRFRWKLKALRNLTLFNFTIWIWNMLSMVDLIFS